MLLQPWCPWKQVSDEYKVAASANEKMKNELHVTKGDNFRITKKLHVKNNVKPCCRHQG
jgi:hypothetical protein